MIYMWSTCDLHVIYNAHTSNHVNVVLYNFNISAVDKFVYRRSSQILWKKMFSGELYFPSKCKNKLVKQSKRVTWCVSSYILMWYISSRALEICASPENSINDTAKIANCTTWYICVVARCRHVLAVLIWFPLRNELLIKQWSHANHSRGIHEINANNGYSWFNVSSM
jgi:hypothetical protein